MATLATASTSSFFRVTLPSSNSSTKGIKLSSGRTNLGGLEVKHASCGGLQVKANAQTSPEINFSTVATSVQDGLVFHQNFTVRSYEVDANRIMSIETLMNYFQVCLCSFIIIQIASSKQIKI